MHALQDRYTQALVSAVFRLSDSVLIFYFSLILASSLNGHTQVAARLTLYRQQIT